MSGTGSRVGDEESRVSAQAERYTMALRNMLFALIGFAYDTPLVMVLLLGGIGYMNGWVTLGPDHRGHPLHPGAGRAAGAG